MRHLDGAALAGLALLALLALTAGRGERAGKIYTLSSETSRVWFESWSTLDDFVGETEALEGIAIVPNPPDFRGTHGRVEIVVDSFRTGIGMRDGDLRDALDAERYPVIVFLLDDTRPAKGVGPFAGPDTSAGPGTPVMLEGWLTVRADQVPVRMPARVERRGDTLRVAGTLTTRFSTLGLEPPSRLFGMIAVEDSLELHFDAAFVPARLAAAVRR